MKEPDKVYGNFESEEDAWEYIKEHPELKMATPFEVKVLVGYSYCLCKCKNCKWCCNGEENRWKKPGWEWENYVSSDENDSQED